LWLVRELMLWGMGGILSREKYLILFMINATTITHYLVEID